MYKKMKMHRNALTTLGFHSLYSVIFWSRLAASLILLLKWQYITLGDLETNKMNCAVLLMMLSMTDMFKNKLK